MTHEDICKALGIELARGSQSEAARRLGLDRANYRASLARSKDTICVALQRGLRRAGITVTLHPDGRVEIGVTGDTP